MDIAASIQSVTNEILLRMARHVRKETGCVNLVLAGGVALNVTAMGLLQREAGFEHVWIQPAAGDAGGALGAALSVWYEHNERPAPREDSMHGAFLGPHVAGTKKAGDALLEYLGGVWEDVLKEDAAAYFDMEGDSPYMLFTCPVRKERRADIPAVTHVDGSARVQTVDDSNIVNVMTAFIYTLF